MDPTHTEKPVECDRDSITPQTVRDRTQKYLERRHKNNVAARRSREKRRINDAAMEQQLHQLKEENLLLQEEIHRLYHLHRARQQLDTALHAQRPFPASCTTAGSLERTQRSTECCDVADDSMCYHLSHTSSPNGSPISPLMNSSLNSSQFFSWDSSLGRAVGAPLLAAEYGNYSDMVSCPAILPCYTPQALIHSAWPPECSLTLSISSRSFHVPASNEALMFPPLLTRPEAHSAHCESSTYQQLSHTASGSQGSALNAKEDAPLDLTQPNHRKQSLSVQKSDFRNVEQLSGLSDTLKISTAAIQQSDNQACIGGKKSSSQRQLTPEERYRERRQRNNEAVRRCRENKRVRLLLQAQQTGSTPYI